MVDDLIINVESLFGRLEKHRPFQGTRHVSLRLGEAIVDGPMDVSGNVVGTLDGVQAEFSARAMATMVCVRCLKRWSDEVTARGSQHFSAIPDEDGYVVKEGQIDVGAPAMDELALSLPAAPVCEKDCRGLCPICGTDLNSDPCDGHGDDSDSPFAVLKDLFDS
ncbi:MAG: DUF177 domain-containing protein [Actinomycetota bacterium]|nr:DUF177 domain-containing protein [Actinomycetota bacterium]